MFYLKVLSESLNFWEAKDGIKHPIIPTRRYEPLLGPTSSSKRNAKHKTTTISNIHKKINAYENLKILLKVVIEEGQKGRRGGGLVGK